MDERNLSEYLMRADAARKAGNTWRFHNWTLLRPESVAQHSFNMLQLAMVVTDGAVSAGLLWAIANHDLGELATGDIPAPTKRCFNQETKRMLDSMEESVVGYIHRTPAPSLTEYERKVLKFCDTMDCMLKCREEAKLGNRTLDEVAGACWGYIQEMEVAAHWKAFADEVYNDYMRIAK